MKYSIFLFAIFIAFAQSAAAQQNHKLSGNWKGNLLFHGMSYNFKTHFSHKNGSYNGSFTMQGRTLPLKNISMKGDSVFFQFNGGGKGIAKFEGAIQDDSLITGKMYQNGFSPAFKMRRNKLTDKKAESKTNIREIFNKNKNESASQQKNRFTGNWKGYISIKGHHLINIVQIKKGKNGYSGTLDVPQQSGYGLRLNNISVTKADSVSFQVQLGGGLGKYKGHFKSDSVITGTYYQRGYSFPFKLTRHKAKPKKKKPKPYHHKDIIIQKNDSIQIGGTLTWPKHQKAAQLVIMISGSGAQNRDEELFGFKPFAQIANYLTRHEIAAYRYDDRGIGESTGNFSQTSMQTLASDTRAIVAYFSSKFDRTFKTIALLGHSEGGMIAGRVAARDSLVDKVILMSSPAFSLSKILPQQKRAIEKANGIPDSTIKKDMIFEKHAMKSIGSKADAEKYRQKMINHMAEKLKAMPKKQRKQVGNLHEYATKTIDRILKNYRKPGLYSLMYYDPAKDLKQLDIPVLALFGGKDKQVPVGPNLKRMAAALDSASVSYQINVFKNANHLYQHAKTGAPKEYAALPPKFVEGLLPTITQWLNRTEQK